MVHRFLHCSLFYLINFHARFTSAWWPNSQRLSERAIATSSSIGPGQPVSSSHEPWISSEIRSKSSLYQTEDVEEELWPPWEKLPTVRRLQQQQQEEVNVTSVATPQELLAAVADGAQHIQITDHLDMSALPVLAHPLYPDNDPFADLNEEYQHAVYINSSFTNTLTGACQAEVPAAMQALLSGAPLQPLAPGQCLFVTDIGGIQLLGSGRIWVDNLYLRARYTGRTPAFFHALLTVGDKLAAAETAESSEAQGSTLAAAYLTGLQVQGDNVFARAGLLGEVQSVLGVVVVAPTFMSGCSIFHTGGDQESLWVLSSTIKVVNSSISDNTHSLSRAGQSSQVLVSKGGLWLQGSMLARNKAAVLLRTDEDETGVIVSDVPRDYITTLEIDSYTRSDPVYTPAPQTPPSGYTFLDGSEGWFVSTSQAFANRPAPAPAFPAGAAGAETRVATAAELQEAAQAGARHILVVAHLDLTALKLVDPLTEGAEGFLLGVIRDTTHSIRGDCSAAPEPVVNLTGASLVPRKPGQCLVVADVDVLTLGLGRLWVHNLYLRHEPSPRDVGVSLMYTHAQMSGQLWMTSCTLQGSGRYDHTATADYLYLFNPAPGADGLYLSGPAYVEGCDFRDLGGSLPAIAAFDTALHIVNSTVSGTFRPYPGSGVISAEPGAKIWLQGTSVRGNRAVLPLVSYTDFDHGDADIYSDQQETIFFWPDLNRDYLEEQEAGMLPVDTSVFLSVNDEWFRGVLAELGEADVQSTAAPEPADMLFREVRTAPELIDAVGEGVRHIRLLDHVDLRGQPLPWPGLYSHFGFISTDTHTIIGNCSASVPASFLAAGDSTARQAGQCAVAVDVDLLSVIYGRLWIDSLYISVRSTSRTSDNDIIICGDLNDDGYGNHNAPGALWLSRLTVAGNIAPGVPQSATGLAVKKGQRLAANGMQVRRFGSGSGQPEDEFSPVHIQGTASFEACSFIENLAASGTIFTSGSGAITRLKNVTFLDNQGVDIGTHLGGRVISSEPGLEAYASGATVPQAVPVQTVWTDEFLSFSDPWLLAVSEEAGFAITSVMESGDAATTAAAPGTDESRAEVSGPELQVEPPRDAAPGSSPPLINTAPIGISGTETAAPAPGIPREPRAAGTGGGGVPAMPEESGGTNGLAAGTAAAPGDAADPGSSCGRSISTGVTILMVLGITSVAVIV